MATMVTKPMSEAEAYVAEGAREISQRLQDLLRQHRRARRRSPDLLRSATEHPVAAIAAVIAGVVLAALVASQLISRDD